MVKGAENKPTIKSKIRGGLFSATYSQTPSQMDYVNNEIKKKIEICEITLYIEYPYLLLKIEYPN